MFTTVKNSQELEIMREGGQMLAGVLELMKQKAVAGISEKELANLAAKELKTLGGEPVFKGYSGYPDVICISVNDAVVHGIPSDRQLIEGDLASFDFGVRFKGLVTDAAFSMIVGRDVNNWRKLVDVTKRSLEAGLAVLQDGVTTGDIGAAVEQVLNKHNFGIVRDLVGHGVGQTMHQEPDIPNYGRAGSGPKLLAGMTVAIEPMATLGGDAVFIDTDGWTVRTADGSASAHFEHTVVILNDDFEILTKL